MFSRLIFFTILLPVIFSPSILTAKETSSADDLKFEAPSGWFQDPNAKERWSGPDPTVSYRKGTDRIEATHYGLEGSRFRAPEEFVSWLNNIFEEPKETREITVAGKKVTLRSFEYGSEGFVDSHGALIPHEFVYEEFVIIPAQSGFWSLTLTFSRYTPLISEPFSKKSPEEKNSEIQPILKDWQQFLKSCRMT